MKNKFLLTAALFLGCCVAPLAATDSPMSVSAATTLLGEKVADEIASAKVCIFAEIVSATPGRMTMSIPPQVRMRMELTRVQAVTPNAPLDDVIHVRYVGNDYATHFTPGETYLFMFSSEDGDKFSEHYMRFDEKNLEAARVVSKGHFVGLTSLGDEGVFAMPSEVKMSVLSLPPDTPKKWSNDYGDGLFKISLQNTSDKDIQVPVRLDEKGNPDWESSVVILDDQKKPHRIVQPMELPKKFLVVKKGETVSGVINALKMKDYPWPQGGNRCYFTFVIANAKGEAFFYYMSSWHDKLRQKAQQE